MTRKDQIKILDDKIKANNAQYDLNRMNVEISAYSNGDLPIYEYKEDKSKKIGLFKRLKNIEDNLVEVDDNDNKVGLIMMMKLLEKLGNVLKN